MKLTWIAGAAWLAASPALAQDCAPAGDLSVEGVTITGQTWHAAAEGLPDHCIVTGTMAERTGADGRDYALSFELRLPDEWNGRFLHQFNGGNDGNVVPALGTWSNLPPGTGALARGMAVVSSDAGHRGDANPDLALAGSNAFGQDFEARRMYGYGAVATLHPAALALTEAYYGQAPDFVYGGGTSNGGRHAMVAAERMPDAFDGLLAGYPGFNLPRAAVQHALDVQAFRSTGRSLAESFTPDDMAVVGAAVAAACDGLDGIEDGMVFDIRACQAAFDPATLACGDGQNSGCLEEAQVAALRTIQAGPKDADGNAIYSDWVWDPGMASGDWRFWKLESPIPPWGQKPLIAIMGSGSLAQVFTTPPTDVEGTPEALEAYLMSFDVAEDGAKIDATTEAFPESAMEVMTPPGADNPSLDELEAAGGKLLIWHGQADPVFSFNDTVNWFETLSANNPEAEDFVRFYAIPGMPHGAGGIAPDQVDLLGALIDWVEAGEAPGTLTGTLRADNDAVPEALRGETRPLCPWPHFASYDGSAFTCQ